MDRRRFLRDLAAGAAAFALSPGLLRAEVAVTNEASRFTRGLASSPWLAGWETVGSEALQPTAAVLEGTVPKDFAGTLYRNGPAWFDRSGFRYRHWFDGDGMVHAWTFADGNVGHRARMVGTSKFTREQAAGRFLLPAAGTRIPDALPIRNNDDVNTANTAVIRSNGRLFALWEGGSATELDAQTLRTIGPVTWREDLVAAPFSAHPLRDRDGSLWNFGSLDLLGGSGLLLWHIGANGNTVRTATLPLEGHGYLHSFTMTDRHLVFMLMPYRNRGEGAAFFEGIRFQADQACRVAVVPKDALDKPRWFEIDFAAVYHFADASERNGEIIAHAVRHGDLDEMRSPMAAAMRGERDRRTFDTDLAALRLDLGSGRARWEPVGVHGLEFPTFDPRTPASARARIHAPLRIGAATAPYPNAIASIDIASGRRDDHRYGADILAEEHLFVPRPGSRIVGDGWLVGTLLDAARGRSGVAILDARHVADGPIAQAWLPRTIPLGFHGAFHPAA